MNPDDPAHALDDSALDGGFDAAGHGAEAEDSLPAPSVLDPSPPHDPMLRQLAAWIAYPQSIVEGAEGFGGRRHTPEYLAEVVGARSQRALSRG
jgi:hypothetical protein